LVTSGRGHPQATLQKTCSSCYNEQLWDREIVFLVSKFCYIHTDFNGKHAHDDSLDVSFIISKFSLYQIIL